MKDEKNPSLHPSSFPFYPALVPEREVEQRREVEAVVARAAAVLFEEARDVRVVEEAAAAHRRVHHARLKLSGRRPPEPALDRRAEAPLAPVQNVARENLFQRALQDVLAAPSLHLQ